MINLSDHPEIGSVIGFFEEISKIPRGSGNTDKIAEYLYNFGKKRELYTVRDSFNNVIIKKDATKGRENRPTLVLQGHSDIVAEKEPFCDIDMENEGVRIYRDGDFIKADGTTLGADDGIALAYALAILDSKDIAHPALECVFTSDEETGLTGAMNIDPDEICGRMMINLDSGDEGVFTVGCAGGARADIEFKMKRSEAAGHCYKLSLEGLIGGHSGVEIDKGRSNAIKVMGELLSSLSEVRLTELYGGNADNAIPREAYAVFFSEEEPNEEMLDSFAKGLTPGESAIVRCEGAKAPKNALTDESTGRILSLIRSIPTGVYKMSEDICGLVETSLNVGVCKLCEECFNLTVSVRSSKGEEKRKLLDIVKEKALALGASVETRGDYPGWAYKKESALRDIMKESFIRVIGKEPKIIMIHAGLECGIFSDKLPGLDCVSTGPNHFDIHTPKERLSLSSTERVWKFLLDVLENI